MHVLKIEIEVPTNVAIFKQLNNFSNGTIHKPREHGRRMGDLGVCQIYITK